MASRAAALDLRVALDTTGSSGPGRPTETGRADRLSGNPAQPRALPRTPGLPVESGQVPVSRVSRSRPHVFRSIGSVPGNVSRYPFETRESAASFPATLLRSVLLYL